MNDQTTSNYLSPADDLSDRPVLNYLARADNLAVALEAERVLAAWDNQPQEDVKEPVASLLSNRENLEIARAVVQRIKLIKNSLLVAFGAALNKDLEERLGASIYRDGWQIKPQYDRPWTRVYASTRLLQKRVNSGGSGGETPCLRVSISRSEKYVNYGVSRSWNKKNWPAFWELSLFKQLETRLKRRGFRFWISYNQLYDLREDEFWLAMSGSPQTLITRTTDAVWDIFDDTREMIEEANQALARMWAK